MLDPITPHYLADLVSWGAIGARTTESQTHREMASGLSFPVGFKNGTDGNLQIAIDAMGAARHPHSFLGINNEGRNSIVQTTGNPDVHIVLRGGNDKPNYSPEDIPRPSRCWPRPASYRRHHGRLQPRQFLQEPRAPGRGLNNVVEQIAAGNRSICALMIESNLEAGNQPIPEDLAALRYGVSVTDKCVDWATTERMLRHAHAVLKRCGGRPQ